MGKRSYSGGGPKSKKYKGGALLDPGQVGIYASCNRHKEGGAAKELKSMLFGRIEEYYPNIDDKPTDDSADNETTTKELSIEDAIKKELEDLKTSNKDSQQKDIIKEVSIGCDSLIFIKTRKPVIPSEFTIKLCTEFYETKAKTSRFIQKLTPIDESCNATEVEFKKLAERILKGHFDNEEAYSINLIKRNFSIIERDTFNEIIAGLLPGHRLNYRHPDKMINIFCFKNHIGMSVVNFSDYDKLCKFNVQQIFDKVNGLIKEKSTPAKAEIEAPSSTETEKEAKGEIKEVEVETEATEDKEEKSVEDEQTATASAAEE